MVVAMMSMIDCDVELTVIMTMVVVSRSVAPPCNGCPEARPRACPVISVPRIAPPRSVLGVPQMCPVIFALRAPHRPMLCGSHR